MSVFVRALVHGAFGVLGFRLRFLGFLAGPGVSAAVRGLECWVLFAQLLIAAKIRPCF